MVDSVATMALETLRDLLIEEAKLLSSVGGQIEEVQRQLQTMHCFLKDADKRRDSYSSETVRDWVAKLRDLSIEAENVLERYAIQVRSKREGKSLKNKLKRFACILGECLTVHEIGKEVEGIISRMEDLTRKAESLNKGATSSSSSSPPYVDDELSSRRTYGHEVERYFVGMKEELKLLESLVTSDDKSNQVISICGMGGLGKTTLATKIYQMESVQRCFEARSWICISQQLQRKTVLQEVLKQLCPNEAFGEQSEDELVRKLCGVQREKRCLVVLDDIWEVDHWNRLKSAFPIGDEHCQVLLTSRNERIAETEYVHKLECLSEDEGWELLQKIALPGNHSQGLSTIDQSQALENIGREMVRKCGCLPLPISVIGGILRQEKTRSEWEKVCKDIDSYLLRGKGVEENKNVKQVLDLSYNLLPYNLKSCFLYLGCFPEDKDIPTEDLYLLWMGEGMVSSEDKGRRESLRDVAERYLLELANRCMVQVEIDEWSAYNKFRSCRLHDLMRDLCLSKGKQEGFFEVLDEDHNGREDASSVSRLVISPNIKAEDCQLQQYQKLRSLLLLNREYYRNFRKVNLVSINFGMFKSLKILIFEGCKFQTRQLPKGIENLILLKHLSIAGSLVDELPTSVCKLPCLQSLNLATNESIILPNLICKLKRLKYLVLPSNRSVLGGGNLKLDGLNELETLLRFNSSIDDAADLIKLQKLRVFDGDICDESSLAMIVDHILNHQDQFRETRFIIKKECKMTNSQIDGGPTLLEKILMCHSLTRLSLDCRLDKLPSYGHHLGKNLVELWYRDCYVLEDPMEMLEKLPVLKELYLGKNSFIGKEMVCRPNGFPLLKELELGGLPNLVEWRVEENAMPMLSELSIFGCRELEMIPEGLKSITTLKILRIYDMPEEFKNRVRVVDGREGQDYHKIKHIPNVRFSFL